MRQLQFRRRQGCAPAMHALSGWSGEPDFRPVKRVGPRPRHLAERTFANGRAGLVTDLDLSAAQCTRARTLCADHDGKAVRDWHRRGNGPYREARLMRHGLRRDHQRALTVVDAVDSLRWKTNRPGELTHASGRLGGERRGFAETIAEFDQFRRRDHIFGGDDLDAPDAQIPARPRYSHPQDDDCT